MHVFTYGSLMFPEVWQRVVRGHYRFAPAILAGHVRRAIVGESYPGMVALAGASVQGLVYFDVGEEDLAALDAFEGPDYRRDRVSLALAEGGTVEACAYVYLDRARLAAGPWHPERFQLQRFIETYCGLAAGDDAGTGPAGQ